VTIKSLAGRVKDVYLFLKNAPKNRVEQISSAQLFTRIEYSIDLSLKSPHGIQRRADFIISVESFQFVMKSLIYIIQFFIKKPGGKVVKLDIQMIFFLNKLNVIFSDIASSRLLVCEGNDMFSVRKHLVL